MIELLRHNTTESALLIKPYFQHPLILKKSSNQKLHKSHFY